MKCISAIFIDAGLTFLSPRESIGKMYARLGKEIGYHLRPGRLNMRISAAWEKYLHTKHLRGFQCTNALLIEDWKLFVGNVLGPKIQADDFERLFIHIYRRLGDPEFYTVADGFPDTVERLKEKNIRLGLISNWDDRLPKLLKGNRSQGINNRKRCFLGW